MEVEVQLHVFKDLVMHGASGQLQLRPIYPGNHRAGGWAGPTAGPKMVLRKIHEHGTTM